LSTSAHEGVTKGVGEWVIVWRDEEKEKDAMMTFLMDDERQRIDQANKLCVAIVYC